MRGMEIMGCMAIILVIFGGDLWIKDKIEKSTEDGTERCAELGTLPGGCILIRKYHNKGAMLNLGQSRHWLVKMISVILSVLAAVIFVFSLGRRGNKMLRIGLAFLLGGAFSNTYDRLKRGYVVDYFSFHLKWKRLRNIVFNLSDFCIMIGALLLVLDGMG